MEKETRNVELDKEVDRFLVEACREFKKDGQLMGKIAEEVSEVAYHFVNWHKEKLISFLVSESNFLHKQCQEGKGDLAKQYRAEIYREIVAKLKDM